MSLALVIATFVGEGEREGVMVVSPAIAFYVPAFDKIVGNVAADFMVAGLILSMNTATMDGSRAVRGLTRRDDAQELGVLNSRHVPARAMTIDMLVNVWLLTFLHGAMMIIAAGNLGYFLANIFAKSGSFLLRKDRPDWPRPYRVRSARADRRLRAGGEHRVLGAATSGRR